jgi:EAL domain-containing protein (putative c-di-GMP-specific phosphodiesterase class I)
MLLRNLGVGQVIDAADGAAALALLATKAPPDVVLCDIDMPGMDGLEFIRHVAEGELAEAVIIASALDAKVVQAVRALGEGYGVQVLGAIEKPLTARRLGELLESYRPRRGPRSRFSSAAGGVAVSASEARIALEEGRIAFHLRPSVDVATGQLAAADAVARWHDADKGWIPPSTFVPLLEREALLGALTSRAIDGACAHLAGAAAASGAVAIAIDLPPTEIHDPTFADRTADGVRAAGVDPALLTFELDERAFRNAAGAALGLLTRLRVKGFGVGLDGFGAGHASFEQLRAVPLTELKLAPALVAGAGRDPRQAAVLEEAIELGRRLDVVIVGDGCDSEDDLSTLLALGCDRVQGAFIADAMSADELQGWASTWDPFRLAVGGSG